MANEHIQQAAEKFVGEILARRDAERAMRAQALENHPKPLSMKMELSRAPLAAALDAAAPPPVAEPVTTTSQTAGYLLAIGDSWFDYPIHNVLTKLEDHFGYNAESSAHNGDAIEGMVSHLGQLNQFARNLDKVIGFGATPKAVLVSGGGNDIAGKGFEMLLDSFDLKPLGGLNQEVATGLIDTRIEAAYRMMFASINALCQQRLGSKVPILIHGYDRPVPDGRGFLGGFGPLPGPWLKPGFDVKFLDDIAANILTMADLIDHFNTMLQRIILEPGFENVHYVDLRGTLPNDLGTYKQFWANELHPTGGGLFGGADGFLLVAERFQVVLSTLP